MSELLVEISSFILLGIAGQWIAWRLKLPSILMLLLLGFLAGPVFGWLHPDDSVGDLLRPIVSLAVAVILFEGGLALRFSDIRRHGAVVFGLVTVGALATFAVTYVVGTFLLGLPGGISLILAGVLVVSGPTVIGPLLRHVRPKAPLTKILLWEGIVIDPIGAVLTALVFQGVVQGASAGTWVEALMGMTLTVLVGAAVGASVAVIWIMAEDRYWIPDFLAVPVGLGLVVFSFMFAETTMEEAGFFAVTILGVILANQERISVRHILDFKEDLSQILIGGLFILLAARVDPGALASLWKEALILIAALVLVARPLAVLLSSLRSELNWREKAFLIWMAPRGIVAAAVAAFFALRLSEGGFAGGEVLVPLTFLTIVGTVTIYGLTARPVARMLKVAEPDPHGILLIGANPVTRAFAKVLQQEKLRVVIADTDRQALTSAATDGIETVQAKVLDTHLSEEMDLSGIGQLWAVTPSVETNSLAAVHFADEFGRMNVYQVGLPEESDPDMMHPHLRGRTLFGRDLTYQLLRDRLGRDEWTLRRTPITDQFTAKDYRAMYGERAIPLWVVKESREVVPYTQTYGPDLVAGRVLVSLVRRQPKELEVALQERVRDGQASVREKVAGHEAREAQEDADQATSAGDPAKPAAPDEGAASQAGNDATSKA